MLKEKSGTKKKLSGLQMVFKIFEDHFGTHV